MKRHRFAARALTALALAMTGIGLLSFPVGLYDDSLLLVGARLVGAGRLPYVDFYSHYGPLGFTLISGLVRLFGDAGLALRSGEILLLIGIAVALHALFGSLPAGRGSGEYAVALIVLVFSRAAMYPAFFGFGFAAGALALFLLARLASTVISARLLAAGAGAAFAAAALIRPAFAGYIAAALLVLEACAEPVRIGALRSPISAFVPFFGAAALAAAAAWALLFPGIPPAAAFDATVLAPARLMGAGSGRFLDPRFLNWGGNLAASFGWAAAAGASLAALTVAWALALAPPGRRWLRFLCVGAGGLLPLTLTFSIHPGRDSALLALALFGFAASVAFGFRRALGESPLLRASAAFGLAAAAFGHYFWARADSAHLAPLFALSFVGAALLLPRLRAPGRLALIALFFGAEFLAVSSRPRLADLSPSRLRLTLEPFYVPAAKVFKAGIVKEPLPWRCTRVPPDERDAVAFADSLADPASRFVAVGSSQAWSSGNPVVLFLISSRFPYTRWYHYDPGLQSSPGIQKEMERELESSGSRSAVVWKAQEYLFDRHRPDLAARSEFDDFFARLYPTTAARFGDYEVRIRAGD